MTAEASKIEYQKLGPFTVNYYFITVETFLPNNILLNIFDKRLASDSARTFRLKSVITKITFVENRGSVWYFIILL